MIWEGRERAKKGSVMEARNNSPTPPLLVGGDLLALFKTENLTFDKDITTEVQRVQNGNAKTDESK